MVQKICKLQQIIIHRILSLTALYGTRSKCPISAMCRITSETFPDTFSCIYTSIMNPII